MASLDTSNYITCYFIIITFENSRANHKYLELMSMIAKAFDPSHCMYMLMYASLIKIFCHQKVILWLMSSATCTLVLLARVSHPPS